MNSTHSDVCSVIASMSSRFLLCLLGAALLASIFVGRFFQTRPAEVYALKGGEVIAIRSLANGRYLELEQKSGRVIASAVSADAPATQWQVLVLDSNTVAALLRSAQKIDERSTAFNGRRMVSASGCSCSMWCARWLGACSTWGR